MTDLRTRSLRVAAVAAMVMSMASGSAEAEAARWSIAPPEGWTTVTEAAEQRAEVRGQRAQVAKLGSTLEQVTYARGADELSVIYVLSGPAPGTVDPSLSAWEAGARDSVAKVATEVSYHRNEVGNTIVVDELATIGARPLQIRRIVGIDSARQIVSVSATCSGSQLACAQTLRSLTLDRSGLRAVDHPSRRAAPDDASAPQSATVNETSSAYRAGRFIGIVVAGVLLGTWWVLNERRKRLSASRARRAKLGGR